MWKCVEDATSIEGWLGLHDATIMALSRLSLVDLALVLYAGVLLFVATRWTALLPRARA